MYLAALLLLRVYKGEGNGMSKTRTQTESFRPMTSCHPSWIFAGRVVKKWLRFVCLSEVGGSRRSGDDRAFRLLMPKVLEEDSAAGPVVKRKTDKMFLLLENL